MEFCITVTKEWGEFILLNTARCAVCEYVRNKSCRIVSFCSMVLKAALFRVCSTLSVASGSGGSSEGDWREGTEGRLYFSNCPLSADWVSSLDPVGQPSPQALSPHVWQPFPQPWEVPAPKAKDDAFPWPHRATTSDLTWILNPISSYCNLRALFYAATLTDAHNLMAFLQDQFAYMVSPLERWNQTANNGKL
jgi:hypothetical protein